jgi:hypothetical protein
MDAKHLDAVELSGKREGSHVRIEASAPPDAEFFRVFVRMFDLRDIDVITLGIKAKRGFGTDWGQISYGKAGVDVMLSNDSEVVPVDAFERFIARLLRVSIDAAKRAGASETREPWWARAVQDADAIIARAYPKGL